MAIITAHKFIGDAAKREFQVGDSILSKSHCRVWVNDLEPDSSTWDLLGSTILFDTAPSAPIHPVVENIRIYVSNDGTFPNEYTSPSSTEIVETYIQNVVTVAGGIDNVSTLSAISTEIVALAGIVAALSSLYTDKAKLDSLYADKNKLDSLFADKATLDGLFNSKTAIDSLYLIQNKLESLFADKTGLDAIYANLTELLNIDVLAAQVAADKIAIETIYDNFDDRYLGNKASDPALDNDGNALLIGAVYFNTTVNHTRFYNGSAWEDPEQTSTSAAAAALASQVAAALSESNALASANASEVSRLASEAALASINTAIANAIGVTVQGYDANTVKYDVAGKFSTAQRTSATAEDNTIDFTANNDFTITLGVSLTVTVGVITGCDGQAGSIVIADVENIAGWSGFTWLGVTPTLTTGVGMFSYKIIGTTVYIVKVENA